MGRWSWTRNHWRAGTGLGKGGAAVLPAQVIGILSVSPYPGKRLPIAAGSVHRYFQLILDFHLPETLEDLSSQMRKK